MSLERMFKVLMSLGLSPKEAEIYVYLATKGPREAGSIAENLRISRQQLSSSLKSLQERKIVISALDDSIKFSALPFGRTLALLVKAKRAEAKNIEENREKILSTWRSMMKLNSTT